MARQKKVQRRRTIDQKKKIVEIKLRVCSKERRKRNDIVIKPHEPNASENREEEKMKKEYEESCLVP